MPRPSMRPTSARQQSRSINKIPKQSKQTQEISLPEDDDDFRPRSRKKRSKEQTKETDAKKREHFEEQLEELADDLLESIDGDEKEGKKAVSVFQKDFKKLREQLSPDNTDLRVDQTSAAFYRASLAMLTDLVPIAEKTYRSTAKESAAYALAALINQIRDLNNDVKLSEDIEGRLIIIKQLIKTDFVRIADFLLREKYALHTQIDSLTTDGRLRKAFRKELDKTVLSFAKGLQEYQNLMTTQISLYLMGDPNYLNPSANSEDSQSDSTKEEEKAKEKNQMRFNGRKQFAGAFGRSGLVKKSVYNKPIKQGETHPYGDDWSAQSALCKKRDDYRCMAHKIGLPKCGNRFPPPLSHLLHAHHIVRWVKSKDNRLTNLVTLCLNCHERTHKKKIGCQEISKKQIEFSKKLR